MINLGTNIQIKNNETQGKIKIFLVLDTFKLLGGAEIQAIQLAKYINETEKFYAQIIGFGDPGHVSKICDENNIVWKNIRSPWSNISILRYFKLKKFGIIIRKLKPDILISYCTWPNIFCGLTWQSTGAQLFIWNQRDILSDIVDSSLERKSIENASLIVSNSEIGKNYLINRYGILSSKIEVIRNSIQLKDIKWDRKQWRNYLGADESSLIICMVANLTNYKDHVTLLHAWDLILKKFENNTIPRIKLVLAGNYWESYPVLIKLIDDLDIQNFVKFLGPVDDISGLLSATDIGVLSSLSEGCPNVILEYMASGLPLVATDIPGIREILPEHQLPYLSPPRDPSLFAELLVKLMNDISLRQKIGKANTVFVYNNFNRDILNKYYLDLIMKNLESDMKRDTIR